MRSLSPVASLAPVAVERIWVEDENYWREAAGIEDWIAGVDSPFADKLVERAERARPPATKLSRAPKGPAEPEVPPHERIAVTKAGAGRLLGNKSVDWVEDHVLGEVRTIRVGATVLIRVRDLEDWADKHAARALWG